MGIESGHRLSALAALCGGPRWDRSRLDAFRVRRLRELVGHAATRVPYYRELLAGACLPASGGPLEELLAAIPITCKPDVQGRPARELVAAGFDLDRLVVHATSGSTGLPFSIRRTRFEETLLLAFRLRANRDLGLRLGDRRVKITFARQPGAFAAAPAAPRPWHARLGLLRQEQIHCLLPPDEIVARLRQIRPHSLGGYPSALLAVARAMTSQDRQTLRPRLAWAAGETLTDAARGEIEAALGRRLCNQYGAHEANLIAIECALTGNLHVLDDAVIVEVIRAGRRAGPGEEGEVVITPLHSRAMPLLRFALGDVAVAGPPTCPCGAPCSTLTRVVGRTVEYFPLAGGELFHPYRLAAPLLAVSPWLRQFQVAQQRTDLVVVRAVAWQPPTAAERRAAEQALTVAAAGRFTVRVELVERLAPAPGGKAQPYRSEVTAPATRV